MNIVLRKSPLMLLALLLGGCSSSEVGNNEPFANEQAAAVHFLKPLFTLMDCEGAGLISKGEVDEHFFEVFYSLDKRRSLSIRQDDLEHAYFDSSKEQMSYTFNLMDENANGVVSTKEFRSFMYRVIDWVDTEKKGEVTLADVGLKAPKIIRAQDR